jgi:uncharacterized membrane protein
MAAWNGPLPPPGALRQFNDIIPQGAERIMQMVEREQEHRIDHEKKAMTNVAADYARQHWLGAAISALAIGGSVLAAYLGAHPTVSIALVGLPIVGIVQAILKRK